MKRIHWDKCNIVGTVCDAASQEVAMQKESCDVVEYRLDLFQPSDTLKTQIKKIPHPTILTVRDEEEGGFAGLCCDEREDIFMDNIKLFSAVDIEASNIHKLRRVIYAANGIGKDIIISMHNFHGVPTHSTVWEFAKNALRINAKCIKIAALTETPKDIERLAKHLEILDGIPFALMGMGKLALDSRKFFMQHGSCLNYGSLGTATAPGQPTAQELKNERRK